MSDAAFPVSAPEAAVSARRRIPRFMAASVTLGPDGAESLSVAGQTAWERTVAAAESALPPPRLLMVLAHPDDEVLALGARLERLSQSRIVTVTDGAPADGADALHHGFESPSAYREARHAELIAALAHAELPANVLAPFPSLTPVPDQRAAWHLEELTLGLLDVLQDFAPEAVLTHPYEGGHPDHDACAFAVHTALRLGRQRALGPGAQDRQPLLLEVPFYHNDGNGGLRTGAFLHSDRVLTLTLSLSLGEQANKRARLAYFTSQAETLGQFQTESESFRVAPAYDFTQPPHGGKLLYECFPWGMTGSHFRSLAAEAEHRLACDLRTQNSALPAGEHP